MRKGSLTGGGRLKAVVAMRQLTVSPFLCRWLWLKLELESDLAELDVSVWYISSQFFEKQPDEIFSHLSEKGSNGRVFFVPEKLENHTNEGKGKEKTKNRGGRKEERRKKQWLHSYFLQWLLWRFLTEKNCLFTFPSIILVFFNNFFCQEIYCWETCWTGRRGWSWLLPSPWP